jgi:hypothetical protein
MSQNQAMMSQDRLKTTHPEEPKYAHNMFTAVHLNIPELIPTGAEIAP